MMLRTATLLAMLATIAAGGAAEAARGAAPPHRSADERYSPYGASLRPAELRQRVHARRAGHRPSARHKPSTARPAAIPAAVPAAPTVAGEANIFMRYVLSHVGGAPVDGLPAPLRAKLHEIQGKCSGFRVISTINHSRFVAGTSRVSLHVLGKAADFVVSDWKCAYVCLVGYPGGVSIDPWSKGHIHISYARGSGEWGARFAHGGRRHHHRRPRAYVNA